MASFKYEGIFQENEFYIDHEFSDGDPCKLYRVSLDKEQSRWYGTILTSEDAQSGFEDEADMPDAMLSDLLPLITVNKSA